MLKKIFKILKRILLACFLLYGYNLIAMPLGVIIPINLITVLFISMFGVSSLFGFITIFLIMF